MFVNKLSMCACSESSASFMTADRRTDRQGLGARELRRKGERKQIKETSPPPNNLYNYHHLLLFLSGKETLHPFGAIAPGSVTSKLIITIKISPSARERHWASCRHKELGGCKCRKRRRERERKRRFILFDFI